MSHSTTLPSCSFELWKTVWRAGFPCLILVCTAACQPIQINGLGDRFEPSNHRDWTPELATLPSAEIQGEQILIHNVRNVNYVSNDDFIVKHFDRTLGLHQIVSVDFLVTPFKNTPAIAHTMLSFGLNDGTYLGVSVEIRNELGEEYSPLLGISRQFEITYVIADERDLIRVRTHHRDSDVYVYPSTATPAQAQHLFVDVLRRVNQLKDQPEFYHTFRNNCTTNIVQHVNGLEPERIAFNWRVLLPGFSARYAYDLGLLDQRVPFEDLQAIAHVNALVEQYYDDPNFSQRIRAPRKRIARLAERERNRASTLNAAGESYLQEQADRNIPRSLWR